MLTATTTVLVARGYTNDTARCLVLQRLSRLGTGTEIACSHTSSSRRRCAGESRLSVRCSLRRLRFVKYVAVSPAWSSDVLGFESSAGAAFVGLGSVTRCTSHWRECWRRHRHDVRAVKPNGAFRPVRGWDAPRYFAVNGAAVVLGLGASTPYVLYEVASYS